MQNAGVLGFGRADTAINAYTPSTAVQVNDEGETTIALPTAKNDVDVNGVMFRNLTGASSGTIKGKGQIITFTLTAETELKFTATASGHAAAELVGASGKVYANKVTGDYTITLQAGTYFIASGKKDKELTISRLIFECTAGSAEEHISTVNAAIDAIPDGTLTLASAEAVQNAQMLFSGMSNTLKETYISEQTARYTKLNNAVEQIKSLRVKNVEDIIDQIGTVDANSYDRIAAAREAYEALGRFEDGGTATLQNRVSAAHLKKLTDAEAAFAAFEVQNVIDMINALPAIPANATRAEITEISSKFDAVENAYGNLPDEKKSQVTNFEIFTTGKGTLLQYSNLFNFQDALAAADETNVTLAEGKALKDLHEKLSDAMLSKLSSAETAKYNAIMEVYNNLASQSKQLCFTNGNAGYYNPDFTVDGNTRTTEQITVGGITYTTSLKMEGSTPRVTFTTSSEMTLTLYFYPGSGKKVNIDGTAYEIGSDGILTLKIEEGTHTIVKNTTNTYLFLLELSPA